MPEMRRAALLCLFSSLLVAAACGSSHKGNSNETGRVTIHVITPPAGSPDPFQGLTLLHLEVRENGTLVFQDDFGAGIPITVNGLTAGTGRTVLLQGLDTGTVVSHGMTLPFDFVTGDQLDVPLYFSRSNSFSPVHGVASARVGASSAAFADGRVLVAGGLNGATGLATALLYDPLTDIVATTGTMSTAHAFTQSVLLSTSEVLVAGGATGSTGATAKAEVFAYDATTGTGVWKTGVPAMSTRRRDASAAKFGDGFALVAGGDIGNGFPLASTEVFEWNGTSGTWTPGDPMRSPRMGAVALAVDTDTVLVAGGLNLGAEGGGSQYSRTTDIFSRGGTNATQADGNDLVYRAGYPGVVGIDGSTWLLTGGEIDAGFTAKTETARWTGSDVTASQRADLPTSHRRGGGATLDDGRVLVVGGDTGTRPIVTPVDESQIYDTGADSFSGLGSSPGASSIVAIYPLGDGTSVVVSDAGVMRFNP